MNKKLLIPILGIPLLIISVLALVNVLTTKKETQTLEATVLTKNDQFTTFQDKNNVI